MKKKRVKLGLSQVELAHLADMGRYNISLCENGFRKLTKCELEKILIAFKIRRERNAKAKDKKK